MQITNNARMDNSMVCHEAYPYYDTDQLCTSPSVPIPTHNCHQCSSSSSVSLCFISTHRYRVIVKGLDEAQHLIGRRADVICPSSSEHPQRGDVTRRTNFTVNPGNTTQHFYIPEITQTTQHTVTEHLLHIMNKNYNYHISSKSNLS